MTCMQSQFIFISGGDWITARSNSETTGSVERYDSFKDIWQILPDLNDARSSHSSCVLGETLYVLGGKDD